MGQVGQIFMRGLTVGSIYLQTTIQTGRLLMVGLPGDIIIHDLAIVSTAKGDTNLFATTNLGVWVHPFSKLIATISLNQYKLSFSSFQETQTLRITNNSSVPLLIDSVFTKTSWFSVASIHDTVNVGDTIKFPDSIHTG